MNKLTKNDIIFKDGVFEIKNDFIFNFYEYDKSYQDWKLERDFDSFIESNIYYFKIPVLDVEYKIMCPKIFQFAQHHLPYYCSDVVAWNYFLNYFHLGLFDKKIKDVFIDRKNRLDDEDYKLKSNKIICHIVNECEHNQNQWKLFCEIENTLFLNIKNFDIMEFWNMNENHPINNNPLYKSIKREKKQVCYLLKDKNTGYYKIGKSVNPLKREKTLQSEKPTLILVKQFKNNWESDLQNKYKSQRVRGEWYKLNNIQLTYICTHYE